MAAEDSELDEARESRQSTDDGLGVRHERFSRIDDGARTITLRLKADRRSVVTRVDAGDEQRRR